MQEAKAERFNKMKRLSLLIIITLASISLLSCSKPEPPLLEQVIESGELRVMTLNSPTSVYEGPFGPAGLEYELVSRFADYLGLEAKFTYPETFNQVIPAVVNRDVHFAAAGLTVTKDRLSKIRFTPSYQTIHSQVVYLSGNHKPRKHEDLLGKKIEVIAASSHAELLQNLKKQYPELVWKSSKEASLEQLFQKVLDGEIDFVVADSNEIAINRRYYPKINIGYDISEPEELAWAFPHGRDTSLYDKAVEFIEQIKQSGKLDELLERYYGHVDRLNFVDKRTFWRHVDNRLPKYQDIFIKAAEQSGYDWHLLAAIGYQESHWNPEAKSPTGVRGIMMLTQAAAKQIGVEDRLDPEQSIMGGARYLKRMDKKVPERINYPDRIYLALAGYNVGFGHLEDARILTERRGDNPDKWAHVKKHLPDLSNPKVYKTLKRGYARGSEPVNYVDNIRNFYDLLLWKEKQQEDSEDNNEESFFDGILNNL